MWWLWMYREGGWYKAYSLRSVFRVFYLYGRCVIVTPIPAPDNVVKHPGGGSMFSYQYRVAYILCQCLKVPNQPSHSYCYKNTYYYKCSYFVFTTNVLAAKKSWPRLDFLPEWLLFCCNRTSNFWDLKIVVVVRPLGLQIISCQLHFQEKFSGTSLKRWTRWKKKKNGRKT